MMANNIDARTDRLRVVKTNLLREIEQETIKATARFKPADIFIGLFTAGFAIFISCIIGAFFPLFFFFGLPLLVICGALMGPEARKRNATKQLISLEAKLRAVEKSLEA